MRSLSRNRPYRFDCRSDRPLSDGSEYPWRAEPRGPSFVNLQALPELLRGYKMSDVIAVLGSLDFVVGEVDR